MKKNTIIFSLFLFFACNDSTSEPQSAIISNAEIKMPTPEKTPSKNISIDTTITFDFLMGKFEPAKHDDFLKIEIKYANREGMFIQKKTYESFKKMHAAAKQDGISFVIKSATRNFFSQKNIWEAKWNGKRKTTGVKNIIKEFPNLKDRALKILEFSSMPSTSRHHWGTDIDLNNFTNKYFEKGQGKKEYDWLKNNAHKFGFYQPYTKKGNERPHGYNEEKWHWSYLPLSKQYIDQMKLRMKDELVKGFEGAEVAKEIRVVAKYILGVNQECL
jgi:D-alanyl-D-alanine carboxypeptidase